MLETRCATTGSKPAHPVRRHHSTSTFAHPDCSNIPAVRRSPPGLVHDVLSLPIDTAFRPPPTGPAGPYGYSEGGLGASKLVLQYPG